MATLSELAGRLAVLYPERDQARRVTREAGLEPNAVDLDGSSNLRWFRILEEAERRKTLDRVLAVARAEYPMHAVTLEASSGSSQETPEKPSLPPSPSTDRYTFRILHLSDLHEREALPWMSNERKTLVALRAGERHRVLARSNFHGVLRAIAASAQIDMVCFTGDVADWGLAEEYASATERIDEILSSCGVDRSHLFAVPGNHDVVRTEAPTEWAEIRKLGYENSQGLSDWWAGLRPPYGALEDWREAVTKRTAPFWRWLGESLGRRVLLPSNNPHGRLGYRASLKKPNWPFDVHVIGLDSAWLCGDDNDARKIRLTTGQINRLTLDVRGRPLTGMRLVLMHHPPADLADEKEALRLLAENTDLVIHGHQHDPAVELLEQPDHRMQIVAAGSLYEGDKGDRWINGFQVIDVTMDTAGRPVEYRLSFWAWSEQGHWYPSGALYRSAPGGVLRIAVPQSVPH